MDAGAAALLGALGGAVVASAGSLLVQAQANRASSDRWREEQLERDRTEIRSAIGHFFKVTQRAERTAGDRASRSYLELAGAADELWISHKQLTLLCSPELAAVADALADELSVCIWEGPTGSAPVWKQVHPAVQAFRDRAHLDYGRVPAAGPVHAQRNGTPRSRVPGA